MLPRISMGGTWEISRAIMPRRRPRVRRKLSTSMRLLPEEQPAHNGRATKQSAARLLRLQYIISRVNKHEKETAKKTMSRKAVLTSLVSRTTSYYLRMDSGPGLHPKVRAVKEGKMAKMVKTKSHCPHWVSPVTTQSQKTQTPIR